MNKLASFLFLFLCFGLTAQEPMRVTRSAAVDRNAPIHNIFVDAENNKWVGNDLGVFQVHTVDYASPMEKEEGQESLLRYAGGNHKLLWNKALLFNQMKEETDGLFEGDIDITSMLYNEKKKELWIGTKGIGIFRFDMSGAGELIENMNMDNSKLRTDMINTMIVDQYGYYWVATEEGILTNSDRKWKLYEQYLNIEALAESLAGVWVFGEGYLWLVEPNGSWEEIKLKESLTEGKIKDITFDSQGRMWIASEIITRYNPELETIEKFGAAEYFTSDFPTALAVDQDDAIWVGTEDKGLYLIEKATAMSISCILDKAPSCEGKNDAALKVVVSGGIEPYTFQWNTALDGQNPKGVSPGSYQVTVTDSKGKSETAELQINDPAITVSVEQTQPESGPGAGDGIANVTVTGGQGNYLYQWENGATEPTAENLSSGEYKVTVTDEGGCSSVSTVTISQDAAPLNVAIEQTKIITCAGTATAAISAKISGGRAPFEFNWSNSSLNGESPKEISAGKYDLTITDNEGTTANTSITIEDAPNFTSDILIEAPASTGNADGKATVQLKGGTAPFTYVWDNGESTLTASKLAPGERSVTITDANGCITNASIIIDENILPLSVNIEQTKEVKCAGKAQAALSTQVRGGKGPFQFNWSDANLSGETPTDLNAGEYTLTVTDSEGNTSTASVSIKDATPFTANIIIDAPASTGNADGKATAKTNGGNTPFTFTWDNGESTSTASKLAPGEHEVTVTDANGCSVTANSSIDENILPLSVSIEQAEEIKCNGETQAILSTQVRGGKGPFQFNWSDPNLSGEAPRNISAGQYSLTITDAEGSSTNAVITIEEPKALSANITIDAPASTNNEDGKATVNVQGGTAPFSFQWDNGEKEATASKLAPGERSVTITDANACTTTTSINIDENILPLSVSIEQVEEIKCNGEAQAILSTQVRGGKGPFQFNWSDANLSGETQKNIPAGQYSLTITDAEGSSTDAAITIEEPKALSANITIDAPASTNNEDGKATVNVQGGTAPFSFQWDNGEKEATASKLAPGERSVTITDANGCSTSTTINMDENILPLTVSIEPRVEIKCNGDRIGLNVKTQGGKAPFTYKWNTDNLVGASPANVAAGNYEVVITDALGTEVSAKVILSEPTPLSAEIIKNGRASKPDSQDGLAQVAVNGGTTPYEIKWDNGDTGESTQTLAIGNHSVTVTDAKGCSTNLAFETKKTILPELNISSLRTGQNIRIEELFFEADSFRITPQSIPVLDEVYDFLNDNKTVEIEMGGHTNNIPETAFCDYLSEERAKSVANYIVRKGIEPQRVKYRGYGKRKPISTNRTAEGRARNQRVEIKILTF